MLRHAIVPTLAAVLLGLAAAAAAVLSGAGAAAWLAPAVAPALVGAGLVNACRGVIRRDLMFSASQGAGGSAGPFLFAAWYAAGPAVAVLALTLPFSAALRADAAVSSGKAAAASAVLAVALLRWAWHRAGKLTGRSRPGVNG
jgi:hypothetical protein